MTADIGQAYAGAHHAWCSLNAQQRLLQVLWALHKRTPLSAYSLCVHCPSKFTPAAKPCLFAALPGAILFKETLQQRASDGRSFVQCLMEQGVLPGIKVDEVSC